MKTLVSWIAHNNDFENGKVLETGPTANFHRYFYKSDRHIILSASSGEDKFFNFFFLCLALNTLIVLCLKFNKYL